MKCNLHYSNFSKVIITITINCNWKIDHYKLHCITLEKCNHYNVYQYPRPAFSITRHGSSVDIVNFFTLKSCKIAQSNRTKLDRDDPWKDDIHHFTNEVDPQSEELIGGHLRFK